MPRPAAAEAEAVAGAVSAAETAMPRPAKRAKTEGNAAAATKAKQPRQFKSIKDIEGKHLTSSEVEQVWAACDGRPGELQTLTTSIKPARTRNPIVVVIRNFIVLPGPAWVTTRMLANVHLMPFKDMVAELKSNGMVAADATPLVLIRGGEDTADGKQTGCALCPGLGPKYCRELGILLQRDP